MRPLCAPAEAGAATAVHHTPVVVVLAEHGAEVGPLGQDVVPLMCLGQQVLHEAGMQYTYACSCIQREWAGLQPVAMMLVTARVAEWGW